jgi:hypothetical protein
MGYVWESPDTVAGVGPSRVARLLLNHDSRALGVDGLGDITVFSEDVVSPEESYTYLERYAASGAKAWQRTGACNAPLASSALLVDPRGQSFLALNFAGACKWLTEISRAAANIPREVTSFTDASEPTALAPEDALLVAHSDQGKSRGRTQLGGFGWQHVVDLFAAKEGAGVIVGFQASLSLGKESYVSTQGGAAADQLWTVAQAAPLGTAEDSAPTLSFASGAQLAGTGITHAAQLEGGTLVAGSGVNPKPVLEAEQGEALQDAGWLALLDDLGAALWRTSWLPAVAPRALAAAQDGGAYVAFDVVGLGLTTADSALLVSEISPGLSIVKITADGAVEWEYRVGVSAVSAVSLAVNGDHLAVWGSFSGPFVIGGVSVAQLGGGGDALVMQVDATGKLEFAEHWGSRYGSSAALSVVPHPAGGFIGLLQSAESLDGSQVLNAHYALRVPN